MMSIFGLSESCDKGSSSILLFLFLPPVSGAEEKQHVEGILITRDRSLCKALLNAVNMISLYYINVY